MEDLPGARFSRLKPVHNRESGVHVPVFQMQKLRLREVWWLARRDSLETAE